MAQCIACDNLIEPFISFGRHPLGNGFLTKAQFDREYFFDLKVCVCYRCYLVQLAEQPTPEQMFNENYAFFSGVSKGMTIHFHQFAETVKTRYLGQNDPFVVEIGSNDGIMLQYFAKAGIRHLGIDPSSNVAEVARSKGINTLCRFFNKETAQEVVRQYGQTDAFIAANVMCHIPFLHSVLEGIELLLKPTGIVAFEDPYLGSIIEKTSYDQIYDEHVSLFSATAVCNLFASHGLELIDVIPQVTHGGSMRYVLGRKGKHIVTPSVSKTMGREKFLGLNSPKTFDSFRINCEKSKKALKSILLLLQKQKKRVVGYAATSKSTTVINYCAITQDLVEFISDTTPIKQGKFSPGMHIPVLPYEKFREDYPDYALLFGWNYKDEILAKEQNFMASGGKWIVYVPRVEIL